AGGIGNPTKYRLSNFGVLPGTENRGALAITLNLASLSAPQIRKKNEIPQESLSKPGVDPYPQVYAITAGAIPKVMTSAMLSSSTPNSLVVLVMRAILPSRPSSKTAKPMARAALSKRCVACSGVD